MGNIVITKDTSSTNTWSSDVYKKQVYLKWLHLRYTSDATAGNRWIALEIVDSAGTVIFDSHGGAAQPASKAYHHEFMPGIFRETAWINDKSIQVPIPVGIVIPANCYIKIADEGPAGGAAISAGDSMVIAYQTEEV